MTVVVLRYRSDQLEQGLARAPSDTHLAQGDPSALDPTGREYLEAGEIALNSNAADPCLWLRDSGDKLQKIRPTSDLRVIDTVADLPGQAPTPPRDGETYLIRFAADGTTPLMRLASWDGSLPAPAAAAAGTPSGGWVYDGALKNFVRDLSGDPVVDDTGAAAVPLVDGDLQLTWENHKEVVEVWANGGWQTLYNTLHAQVIPILNGGQAVAAGAQTVVAQDDGWCGEVVDVTLFATAANGTWRGTARIARMANKFDHAVFGEMVIGVDPGIKFQVRPSTAAGVPANGLEVVITNTTALTDLRGVQLLVR